MRSNHEMTGVEPEPDPDRFLEGNPSADDVRGKVTGPVHLRIQRPPKLTCTRKTPDTEDESCKRTRTRGLEKGGVQRGREVGEGTVRGCLVLGVPLPRLRTDAFPSPPSLPTRPHWHEGPTP